MALHVQDDNGSVGAANSYLTVDEFKAYHTDRGNVFSAYSDSLIQTSLVRATDYLDQRFTFVGERLRGRDQTTEWPRSNARDRDRYAVLGIPTEVKEATAEYALRACAIGALNPDPSRDDSGAAVQSKTETVGPITETTTFVSGSRFSLPKYPAADQKLYKAGLVRTGGTLARG